MTAIRALLGREPALTLSVLSAVASAICAGAGKPEYSPVLVAVAAAFLGLRTQVTPAGKARDTAVQAAREAATHTALRVDEATAGRAGEITAAATGIVDDAVDVVTGLLGGKK